MPKTPQPPRSVAKPGKEKSSAAGKRRRGEDFGAEGTNKTLADPKPDGAASEAPDLGLSPPVNKSPYTRG